ncbi:hypothetical protein [uncultured Pedobacter sp.]|uniref:hypothetical protein n=1 Tax=uncultured Pedobacter sp. TaxID=246139 RepID=UPI0025FA1042|nr:hypothetical protein [uncultured Pedobacter sp.]
MKIFDNYPQSTEFKQNELKTLEYIKNFGLIKSPFEELAYSIEENFSIYTGTDLAKFPFQLHIDFLMEVEEEIHRIIIGANIQGETDINSYFLAMCDKEEKQLIRKFHFDFALPGTGESQSVPTFHLQYGGKSTQSIIEKNIGDEKLDHWLSLPRLNFTPMNLALLLDMVFCEFSTDDTRKVYEHPNWRSLIIKNEKFLYENYIKNLYNHISSQKYTKSYLLRDFYYGK